MNGLLRYHHCVLGMAFCFFLLPLLLWAGSLTVGTKVMYPGGADQPPKEKDTGVSLKVDVVGMSGSETEEPFSESASAASQLTMWAENGEYDQMLEALETPKTSEEKAWKAIALLKTGEGDAGDQLAREALKDPGLPSHLRRRLSDELGEEPANPDREHP